MACSHGLQIAAAKRRQPRSLQSSPDEGVEIAGAMLRQRPLSLRDPSALEKTAVSPSRVGRAGEGCRWVCAVVRCAWPSRSRPKASEVRAAEGRAQRGLNLLKEHITTSTCRQQAVEVVKQV